MAIEETRRGKNSVADADARTCSPEHALAVPCRYYRTYPIESPLGYAEEILELSAERTAFLVVDVYGVGFDEDQIVSETDPPIHRKWIADIRQIVREKIAPSINAARAAGIPVIYLTNHLSNSLTEDSKLEQISLRVDAVDLLKDWKESSTFLRHSRIVEPAEQDYLVRKQHYSGFFDTNLDSLLRSLDVRNLVAVGFDSRVCLGNTLTEAMYRDYQVIAIRDAIATREEPETAEKGWAGFLALRFLETHVGFTCTAEQWKEACTKIQR